MRFVASGTDVCRGAVEEVSDAELRDQLETPIVGPWRLTRLVQA
ncbi:hypothetical protein [Streptomyces sp. A1136]|nr:hypothetical protein [Streptomyces sp. A1136]